MQGRRAAALPAGLPHGRPPLLELPRHRQDDRQAVPELPRRRPHRPRAQAHGEDSGGHRHRPAPAPLRRGRARQRRRPDGRPLRRRPRAGARLLPSRGRRPLLRDAGRLPDAGARRQRSRCRRSTATEDDQHSRPARRPGARFKVRGKGMPNVSGRGQGDLHVIARVAVPKKLTKEQKHLLEELAQDAARRDASPSDGRRRREAVLRARQRHLWLSIRRSTCAFRSGSSDRRLEDLLYAALDDFQPLAIQEQRPATAGACSSVVQCPRRCRRRRSQALDAATASSISAARRPGRGLGAPQPGQPDSDHASAGSPSRRPGPSGRRRRSADHATSCIVIDPSMGFGTGHHQTTRLCLALLQRLPLDGPGRDRRRHGIGRARARRMAPGRLRRVTAMDNDPDALQNARENIARQRRADRRSTSSARSSRELPRCGRPTS